MSLDLARARWLQSGVMPSSIVQLAAELPVPELASEQPTPMVGEYLLQWIADANPAGQFHAQTRWRQWLPRSLRVRSLFALGYDGLIYINEGAAVGHVYYQRHGSSLHAFSAAVIDPLKGKGYSVAMFLAFVAHAHSMPAWAARGTGQNSRRLFDCLTKCGTNFAGPPRPMWGVCRVYRVAAADNMRARVLTS